MSKKEKQLAAIMFTDIVGYSSMMQKDEEYASRMRDRHREIFNRWHNQYNGKVLQYYGDGTLSIFSSTTEAVECAVAMQQSLKHNPKVPIRIGIHIGDITYNEEEVIGDGVNIAARIESTCVPGGVFLSGKAFDDIKNHSRLKAKSLGFFSLKNIQQQIEIYAISNQGITFPEYEARPVMSQVKNKVKPQQKTQQKVGRKKKWVAVLLAFFFGIFGSHRFYLQQRIYGIIYLSLFFIGAIIIPDLGQLVAIPAILGFIDFISFLAMSRATFDAKYNPEYVAFQEQQEEPDKPTVKDSKQFLDQQFESYFRLAKQEYSEYNFNGAIEQLIKAIEIKYDDPEAHFLLACCYSISEDAENAMIHIEAAMAFNLANPERINSHDDLAFLRIQEGYDSFTANNYRLPSASSTASRITDRDEFPASNLLEELKQLQQQWENGQLSDEEFQIRKQELKSRS